MFTRCALFSTLNCCLGSFAARAMCTYMSGWGEYMYLYVLICTYMYFYVLLCTFILKKSVFDKKQKNKTIFFK